MYYILQISEDPQFKTLVVNTQVENITDYTPEKDLDYFTVYYWRTKAVNPLTGQSSEWSNVCVFRIKAEDITIKHNIGTDHGPETSYIIYGSEIFGWEHKFVRSYDSECIIPDAELGYGLCPPTSGIAQIGVIPCGDDLIGYCPGVCVPEFEGFDVEYLLTENDFILTTESGIGIILEF